MRLTNINLEERTKAEFDKMPMSQLIIRLAQPWKEDLRKPDREFLRDVIDEGVMRRAYFAGTYGKEGEYATAIKALLKMQPHRDISSLYPTSEHFTTQFEKVKGVAERLGKDEFRMENLNKMFDPKTAATVRGIYDEVMAKRNGHTQGKRQSGTVEGMMEEKINNDLLVFKDLQNNRKHPQFFVVKFGKSGHSAAKKSAEYVARTLPKLQNNLRNVNTHTFDPYMGMAYLRMKGKECLHKDKPFHKLFGLDQDLGAMEHMGRYLNALAERSRREKEGNKAELIKLDKTIGYLEDQKLLPLARRNQSRLSESEKEQLMEQLYQKEGAFTDLRGIQVVTPYGLKGFPSIVTPKGFYKPGTHEVNERQHAEHVKWVGQMLRYTQPKRWRKGLDAKIYEVQKLDKAGFILDLFGPDNKQKYTTTKADMKYGFHKNKKQDKFYKDLTTRIELVAGPLDKAVENLVTGLNRYPYVEYYEPALERATDRMYEELTTRG